MGRAIQSVEDFEIVRGKTRDAAFELFKQGGEDGVSFRALSKVLGYSPMTPYRYFPGGKDELLASVKAHEVDKFAVFLEKSLNQHKAGSDSLLDAFITTYIQYALKDPARFRIMFEFNPMSDHYPELEAAVGKLRDIVLVGMQKIKQAGYSSGDAVQDAQLFWVSVHGLLSLHFTGHLCVGKSIEEFLPFLIKTLKQGLRAERNR